MWSSTPSTPARLTAMAAATWDCRARVAARVAPAWRGLLRRSLSASLAGPSWCRQVFSSSCSRVYGAGRPRLPALVRLRQLHGLGGAHVLVPTPPRRPNMGTPALSWATARRFLLVASGLVWNLGLLACRAAGLPRPIRRRLPDPAGRARRGRPLGIFVFVSCRIALRCRLLHLICHRGAVLLGVYGPSPNANVSSLFSRASPIDR